MLESRQVRHFSQWDLQSLEYFRHLQKPQAPPSGFYISVFGILNPVDPLASVSNFYLEASHNKCQSPVEAES